MFIICISLCCKVIIHEKVNNSTLAGVAIARGIPTVTCALPGGDGTILKKACHGIENVMSFLKISPETVEITSQMPILCSESLFLFTNVGGVLNIIPTLGEWIKKGAVVGTVHSVFGTLLRRFVAPDDAIVLSINRTELCSPGDAVVKLGLVNLLNSKQIEGS